MLNIFLFSSSKKQQKMQTLQTEEAVKTRGLVVHLGGGERRGPRWRFYLVS